MLLLKKVYTNNVLFFQLLLIKIIYGIIGLILLKQFSFNEFLLTYSRNDSFWYFIIVRDNYQVYELQSAYAFFPLYPVLLYLVKLAFLNIHLSAFILNIALLYVFSILVKKVKKLGDYLVHSKNQIWYFIFFPFHFFLFMNYSELLFLNLILFLYISIKQKNWIQILATTILLSLCRPTGLLISCSLLVWFCIENKISFRSFKMHIKSILAFIGAPIGIVIFMFFCKLKQGDYLAFSHAQWGWRRTYDWPWKSFFHSADWQIQLLSIYSIVLIVFFTISWKKFNLKEQIFIIANAIFPLCTGTVLSFPRFFSMLFPFFMKAKVINKNIQIGIIVFGICANLLLFYAWCKNINIITY